MSVELPPVAWSRMNPMIAPIRIAPAAISASIFPFQRFPGGGWDVAA